MFDPFLKGLLFNPIVWIIMIVIAYFLSKRESSGHKQIDNTKTTCSKDLTSKNNEQKVESTTDNIIRENQKKYEEYFKSAGEELKKREEEKKEWRKVEQRLFNAKLDTHIKIKVTDQC